MFCRFDVADAFACLGHDFGLYGLVGRLASLHYRNPSVDCRYERLSVAARAVYDRHKDIALSTTDVYDPHCLRSQVCSVCSNRTFDVFDDNRCPDCYHDENPEVWVHATPL